MEKNIFLGGEMKQKQLLAFQILSIEKQASLCYLEGQNCLIRCLYLLQVVMN